MNNLWKHLPQERDDVSVEGRAPLSVRRFIAKVGGLNPYGEPLYRVVLSQCVLEWHGGEHWDWPDNLSLQDQGGLVFSDDIVKQKHIIQPPDKNLPPQIVTYEGPAGMVPSTCQPIRRVIEERRVQKYPDYEGWIMQRWRPASDLGPSHIWDNFVWPGTHVRMLGPYPEKGFYEMVGNQACEFIPDLGLLETAIAMFQSKRNARDISNDPRTRFQVRMALYESQRAAQQKKLSDDRKKEILDLIKPYMNSSLNAGRMRGELAKDAGITSHVGN